MKLPNDILSLILGIGIPVGAIYCFLGYRIFKFILGLTGFILIGAAAGGIGYALSHQEAIALLTGLAGGLIGAALMVALYYVGVFIVGAILGGVLGVVLSGAAGSSPEPAVLLILAIIGGVVALIIQKFMIILSTSFGGAGSIVLGIAFFTTGAVDPANINRLFRSGGILLYAILLCWLALGIAGVIVQYKTVPTKEKKTKPPAEAEEDKSEALLTGEES